MQDSASHCAFGDEERVLEAMRRAIYVVGQAVRETGQAMDRLGMVLQGSMAYKEQRTQRLELSERRNPRVDCTVDVCLDEECEAFWLVGKGRG